MQLHLVGKAKKEIIFTSAESFSRGVHTKGINFCQKEICSTEFQPVVSSLTIDAIKNMYFQKGNN